MKRIALTLFIGMAVVLPLPAFADPLPLPTSTPASYKAECGSCHLAFPPSLLSANDWRRTIGNLHEHFGTDAAVDGKNGQEISAFLERYAGDAGKLGTAGEPPRLTQTARFSRKHREISAKTWKDPRIKSAANCEACHRGAAQGNYSEHDISIPESRR